jgi:hypothetical protein
VVAADGWPHERHELGLQHGRAVQLPGEAAAEVAQALTSSYRIVAITKISHYVRREQQETTEDGWRRV